MEPYRREKKIKGSGIWKKDYHIKGNRNWWEDLNNFIGRNTIKQKINRQIKKELLSQFEN